MLAIAQKRKEGRKRRKDEKANQVKQEKIKQKSITNALPAQRYPMLLRSYSEAHEARTSGSVYWRDSCPNRAI